MTWLHWHLLSTQQHLRFHNTSSTFSTIRPIKQTAGKAGRPTPACIWIWDFLTDRPRVVTVGKKVSAKLTVSMGPHWAAALALNSTQNCASDQDNNIIVYTDDTIILSLIKGRDKSLYRDLVHNMPLCREDNLSLSV